MSATATCPRCLRELNPEARYCHVCGTRVAGAPRELRRLRAKEKLAGVCAGLADYFDLDPTLVRVVYVVASVFTGVLPGIALYVILALVIPVE